jgi:hypothetical protein
MHDSLSVISFNLRLDGLSLMMRMGETLILGSEEESSRFDTTKVAELELVSGGEDRIGAGGREDLIKWISKAERRGAVPPIEVSPIGTVYCTPP